MASRTAARDLEDVEGLTVLGVAIESESYRLPFGTYRRRLGGGSVAEAAARAAALAAARAALVDPGGRPRRLPVRGLLGVGDAGVIADETKSEESAESKISLAQDENE